MLTPDECKAIRDAQLLSREQMAVKAGVSEPTIGALENGTLTHRVQTRIRKALAAAYGIAPDEIPTQREATKATA